MRKWYLWYMWLSIPAFMLLWGDSSRRILFSKPYYTINDNVNFSLWSRVCGNALILWGGHLMGSILLMNILVNWARGFNPLLGTIAGQISSILIYLIGVYITYKHAVWREKNIPHYLWKKDEEIQCQTSQEE